MGFALAEACAERGAEVLLVAGPVQLKTSHPAIKRMDVESAGQMYEVAVAHFPSCDGAILCAAVADFTPADPVGKKIKREGEELTLTLKPTPDIAATLGKIKRPHQQLVGFALETDSEEKNALGKLERKNLDFIVLNSLNDQGAGFRVDTNKITILSREGKTEFPLKSKEEVAEDIVEYMIRYREKS